MPNRKDTDMSTSNSNARCHENEIGEDQSRGVAAATAYDAAKINDNVDVDSTSSADDDDNNEMNFNEVLDDDYASNLDDDVLEEIETTDFDEVMDHNDVEISPTDDNDTDEEVVEKMADNSVLSFEEHKSPVFCCDIHAYLGLEWIVSGGEDDKLLLWNNRTGEVMKVFDDYNDTVIGIEFNHNGHYLCGADMSGQIVIYKVRPQSKEKLIHHWSICIGDTACIKWHPFCNVLAAGCENGSINLWHFPNGEGKFLHSENARCESLLFVANSKLLLAGYADGQMKLWKLSDCTAIWSIGNSDQITHPYNIAVVASDPTGYIFASGTNSGYISFSNRQKQVHNLQLKDQCIECLDFNPSSDFRVLAAGTLEGYIHIWDYTTYILRLTYEEISKNKDGCVILKWLKAYLLIAASLKGVIYGIDARNGNTLYRLTGHTNTIYDCKLIDGTSTLATTSEDGTVKIFNIPDTAEDMN